MAAECDVVVSGLPKPPDVRRVFEGDDGILAGASGGSVWIDHSTSDFEQGGGGGGNKLSSIRQKLRLGKSILGGFTNKLYI